MKKLIGIEANIRPHPGPLPLEREKRLPLFCDAMRSDNSSFHYCEIPGGGIQPVDFRIDRTSRLLFPLPGGEGQGEGGFNN